MPIDLKQLNSIENNNIQGRQNTESQWLKKSGLNTLFVKKPSATDRMFFTEQLSLLLETGNSLVQSLALLITQTENAIMREVIQQLIEDLEGGKPLSHALRRHTDLFSSTYINLVEVSENGGFMPQVLQELLAMDEKREQLTATIRSALSYPVFLLTFSLAVVIFVLVAVFPKFESMFSNIIDELPATTIFLMAFSNSLSQHWIIYLVGIFCIIIIIVAWLKSTVGRKIIDQLKLKVPGVKTIFSELYVVQSLRVMGLSLENGVSVMDTLSSCRDVIDNTVFRNFIVSLEEAVQGGKGLASGFTEAKFMPYLVRQMIATGDESGSLPKVMIRVSSYYEKQLEKRLTTISKAAEPVMLLVMGVIVGVLVSSLILPIFKLSSVAGA